MLHARPPTAVGRQRRVPLSAPHAQTAHLLRLPQQQRGGAGLPGPPQPSCSQAGWKGPAACAAAGSAQPEPSQAKLATPVLPRTAVVGVLGGGQLGRMMALTAANLGVKVKCLDPAEDAPAAVAAQHVVGHFQDAAAIAAFAASGIDVLTTEIEHVDADGLQAVAAGGAVAVEPSPGTLRIIQNKFAQKQHFAGHGVPMADCMEVGDAQALEAAGRQYGYPLMLKSKRLAYDGRGNAVVRSAEEGPKAVGALGGYAHGLYAERWAAFVRELAVMVVRSRDGSVVSYPVVETVHRDNICHVTEAPAAVAPGVAAAAQAVAEKAVRCLSGAGIFGVEMFLLADGSILLNEVAPRPHNSGHYTMDGCVTSQFENHLRAILGWPLGDTSLTSGCAIMLNILGEADDAPGEAIASRLMEAAYAVPGAKVHWYGKAGMRKGRKVGHINIVAPSRQAARQKLAALDASAAAALEASSAAAQAAGMAGGSQPLVGIIMGSDSDLATMRGAAEVLEAFGVPLELTVVSAHRTPERMVEYARSAAGRGLKVIIAGAGGAAHLPGMVAAMTALPVVGVPVKPAGAYLDGVDALLSIVQMPKGVPVATVAIGNAANAGLLAVRMLGAANAELQAKMLAYQEGMTRMVQDKAAKLEQQGWQNYKTS